MSDDLAFLRRSCKDKFRKSRKRNINRNIFETSSNEKISTKNDDILVVKDDDGNLQSANKKGNSRITSTSTAIIRSTRNGQQELKRIQSKSNKASANICADNYVETTRSRNSIRKKASTLSTSRIRSTQQQTEKIRSVSNDISSERSDAHRKSETNSDSVYSKTKEKSHDKDKKKKKKNRPSGSESIRENKRVKVNSANPKDAASINASTSSDNSTSSAAAPLSSTTCSEQPRKLCNSILLDSDDEDFEEISARLDQKRKTTTHGSNDKGEISEIGAKEEPPDEGEISEITAKEEPPAIHHRSKQIKNDFGKKSGGGSDHANFIDKLEASTSSSDDEDLIELSNSIDLKNPRSLSAKKTKNSIPKTTESDVFEGNNGKDDSVESLIDNGRDDIKNNTDKDSENDIDDDREMLNFSSSKVRTIITNPGRSTYDSDDDEDDDEDLFELALQLEAKRGKMRKRSLRSPNKAGNIGKTCNDATRGGEKQTREDFENGTIYSSPQTDSNTKCNLSKITPDNIAAKSCSSRSTPDSEALNGRASLTPPSKSSTEKKSGVRNPITLMRENYEMTTDGLSQLAPTQNTASRIADDLWLDSQDDRQNTVSSTNTINKKPKNRTKKNSNSQATKNNIRQNKSNGKNIEKNSDSRSSLKGMGNSKREKLSVIAEGFSSSDSEASSDDDVQELKERLYPSFEKPRFGPFPLEALVLMKPESVLIEDSEDPIEDYDDEKATIQSNKEMNCQSHGDIGPILINVPASINRYLLPYQRQGIHFLYQAISMGKGAIMGDEMGLGKTIQIVSLIAALLQKTGSLFDKKILKKRQRLITKHQNKVRADEEKSLLLGKQTNHQSSKSLIEELQKQALLSGDSKSQKCWMPILVIVPPSTFDNWLNEFQTWGYFDVAEYDSRSARDMALQRIMNCSSEILLCAKSLFLRSTDFQALNRIEWKMVIVDEFHLFKNPDGTLSNHLRVLKNTHKSIVIGMTGTLMQNDHKELWNLVDLVETNYLGTWKEFNSEISQPIKLGRAKTANSLAIRKSEKKHMELVEKLKYLFIERKKADVLDDQLPIKDERVIFCELSPIQKRLYEHILSLPDYELLIKAQGPCDCGVNRDFFIAYGKLRNVEERIEYQRKHKEEIIKRRECCYPIPKLPNSTSIHPDAVLWRSKHEEDCGAQQCKKCPFCILFPALHKLYKLSSHAALLQLNSQNHSVSITSTSNKVLSHFEKELEFAKVAIPPDILPQLPGGSYIREDSIMDNHIELSGKMKVLDGLLRKISCEEIGGRVLLFSHSTQTLDLIQNYIRSEGYTFLRMDGSTAAGKRQELVNEFNKDPNIFIFLLSTKAMGLGLNLTAANKVIIFDVEWNPSWDTQAQDRAYRIGQDKDVQVIRLVARGTIDELKYIRQVYKIQLKQETIGGKSAPRAARIFRGVAGDKNRKGELFGTENLLKFKDGSFMQDLWKSADGSGGVRKGRFDLHSAADVMNTFNKMTEDQLDNAFVGQYNEFDQEARKNSIIFKNKSKKKSTSSKAALREKEQENAHQEGPRTITTFVNHNDFFCQDRGGAALQEGDDGFILEMGGESQMMHDIYEKAEVMCDSETESVVERGHSNVLAESRTIRTRSSMATVSEDFIASNEVEEAETYTVERNSAVNQMPDKKCVNRGDKLSNATNTLRNAGISKKTKPRSANCSASPPLSRDLTICGIKVADLKARRTTFSASDFHLPSK